MEKHLLAVLTLASLLHRSEGFLTNYGFRELILAVHRTPNQTRVDVREPLRLSLTKEEAAERLRAMLGRGGAGRISGRQGTSPNASTTTTIRFDDPNFIPGEYLDAGGQAKFVTPPPITDILVDFMDEVTAREDVLWQVGVYILANWMLQAAFLILAAWVGGLYIPMYNVTQKMGETLPMEDEDRVDKMLELAEMYEENPIRFAHLPGFEIPGFDPLESEEEEKEKKEEVHLPSAAEGGKKEGSRTTSSSKKKLPGKKSKKSSSSPSPTSKSSKSS